MARLTTSGRPALGRALPSVGLADLAVAGALAVGSNPLHNLLLLCAAVFVALVCERDSPLGRALGFFVRIGLVLIVMRVLLSAIAVGGFAFGATPLGRLPSVRLPWWLGGLALGGPFTFEMLMVGFIGGMQLLTLLALFGTFNAVADHYGLLRRAPSFLGGAGLAVTIALVFVPQTLQQLVAIREAQQVRGHRFRGWRDALPLLVPLIVGGLERSLYLAEAMDSRGYGGAGTRPQDAGRAVRDPRRRDVGLDRGLLALLSSQSGSSPLSVLADGVYSLDGFCGSPACSAAYPLPARTLADARYGGGYQLLLALHCRAPDAPDSPRTLCSIRHFRGH